MPQNNSQNQIIFFAEKIHVHHWPLNSPIWSKPTKEKIELDLNKNTNKKKITITDREINIDDYKFDKINKVGITVPLFKKQTTIVFEGHFEDSFAHIHITTRSQNYIEIFNNLIVWKNRCFPDFP